MKIYSFILFILFRLSIIAQIDTLKDVSKYYKCIDSSIIILKYMRDGKFKEVRRLLPNNLKNQPYFNKKYLKKEMNWVASIIKENGFPSPNDLIILKKTIQVPSLNIIDEDIVICFIFPFSMKKNGSTDKIEMIFKHNKVDYYLETINFNKKNSVPMPLPPK